MPKIEISAGVIRKRKIVARALSVVLPFTIDKNSQEVIAQVNQSFTENKGVVVCSPHFGLGELDRILAAFYLNIDKAAVVPTVAPIAQHQTKVLQLDLEKVGDELGVALCPITTRSTKEKEEKLLRKYKPIPWEVRPKGAGTKEYAERSKEVLHRGGFVLFAPQGERQSTLTPFEGRPVSLLLRGIRQEQLDVEFVVAGIHVKGATDYSKLRGFNWFRQHEIVLKSIDSNTLEQIARERSFKRGVDDVIYQLMLDLAPSAYRPG